MPKSSKKQPVFVPVSYTLSPALEAMQNDFIRSRLQNGKTYKPRLVFTRNMTSQFDREGCRRDGLQGPVYVKASDVFCRPMHKLVLAEIPGAMIALRLKDEALGKLFGTSQTLRDMMSDAECYSAYNFAKVYTKKPTEVSWNEWNNAKDGSVGAVVREAIQRLINNARYTRQDANLAETIKVRQMLAFLSNLPALAKVKIIKVKKIHDDEPQSQRSRRANRSVAAVSPVVVNELEMAY